MREEKPEKTLTRQQSINQFCKNCCYDPLDSGTWRQQTERCQITDCFLWAYRPVSRPRSTEEAH
jgi:hypothetical protein